MDRILAWNEITSKLKLKNVLGVDIVEYIEYLFTSFRITPLATLLSAPDENWSLAINFRWSMIFVWFLLQLLERQIVKVRDTLD